MKHFTKDPKMARRVYECKDCGHRVVITTNHKSSCWPTCKGKCRYITNPHTSREMVFPKNTTHLYIEEWDGNKAPNLTIVD